MENLARIKNMTFKEAKDAVKAIAGSEYHSIQVDLTETNGGDIKVTCKAYIASIGWTDGHSSWGQTIEDLLVLKYQKEHPAAIDSVIDGADGVMYSVNESATC